MGRAIFLGVCCAAVVALAASCGHGRVTDSTRGAGSSSTSGSSGTGGAAATARLVAPAVIDLPYTVAGMGGSSVTVPLANDGDAPLDGLVWSLQGDPSLSLGAMPASIAPSGKASVVIDYAGSPAEAIVSAVLTLSSSSSSEPHVAIPVFAASGDPALGAAAWEDVIGAGGVVCGTGATVAMPAAPYPDGGSTFTDPSVRVFLAESYRDRGAQDLVVHFHGFDTTLASTLATHLYQSHVYASGANAVLVVPQGPVNAASGDFGKLMSPGGLARLTDEVLVLLYREGKIQYPRLGELALTSHSGGYQAVALNLMPGNMAPAVTQIDLFDSLYGYISTYQAWTLGGGILRSNYSPSAGTLANNQAAAASLAQQGLTVATTVTQVALRDAPAVIDFADTTHDGTTRLAGAFGERLRWKLPHGRRGPRIELRQVVASGGTATARWLAPADTDVEGFAVERSTDGQTWSVAAQVHAGEAQASFALAEGARVRVRPRVKGMAEGDALASDTYRVDPGAAVLVVDGFDRILDGDYGGLNHDFAAVVGEAAGPVASIAHRAVTEDGFDLSAWPTVLWLLGDESTGDLSLSSAEQALLQSYVDAGGHLVVSGSELGYDIGQTTAGAAFLDHCFGVQFVADDSGSHAVTGAGALSAVTGFTFGGPGAPYTDDSPDALAATSGESGEVVLTYGNGMGAAVGIAGRGALVGFPLELVDAPGDLARVVKALLAFAGG